jgi:hypothetical protein
MAAPGATPAISARRDLGIEGHDATSIRVRAVPVLRAALKSTKAGKIGIDLTV